MSTPARRAVLPALAKRWLDWRGRLFDHGLAVVAVVIVVALVALVAQPWGYGALGTTVFPGVPWWPLLVLTVPATAWSSARSISLARFGGAVMVAVDAGVLAFVLWLGLGARLGDLCGAGSRCTTADGTEALLGIGSLTLLAWLVGVVVAELRQPRKHLDVHVFNISLGAIGGAAFLAVTYAARWDLPVADLRELSLGSIGPRDLLAVVGAAVVYTGLDLMLTAVSVAWSERVRVRDVVHDVNALLASATAVGVLCCAVFAALLTLHNPWSLVLLLPVLWALLHAASVGALASSEQERSKAIYSAAEACQRAEAAEDILEAVVAAAGRSLHAKVVLADPAGEGNLSVEIRRGATPMRLTARRRSSGRVFSPQDSDALATLAALASQALARVDSTEKIRRTAEQDALTGLSTRRVLLEEAEAATTRGDEGPVSLIFCDVDDFKTINDTYGHGAGDAVLVEVARRLRAQVRPDDVVARLGGDEFAVLLPQASAEATEEVCERLLEALAVPHRVSGRLLAVGLSVGRATWLPGVRAQSAADATDWLLDEADRGMYEHKRRHHGDLV